MKYLLLFAVGLVALIGGWIINEQLPMGMGLSAIVGSSVAWFMTPVKNRDFF